MSEGVLLSSFSELDKPEEESTLIGVDLGENKSFYLCKDNLFRPQFLIEVKDSDSYPPPPTLRNLEVQYGVYCSIQTKQELVNKRWIRVICTSDSEDVVSIFLNNLPTLITDINLPADANEFSILFEKLTELFRLLSSRQVSNERGLWGELFIISEASNKDLMVESWHNENMERYDFGLENSRLEVKTCSPISKKHTFSLGQVYPNESSNVVLTSVCLDEVPVGLSLRELWNRVRQGLGSEELKLKLDTNVAKYLGEDFSVHLDQVSFDEELARNELRYFDIKSIPKPPNYDELDNRITSLKFQIDLDGVEELNRQEFSNFSELFEVILNT